MLSLRSKLSLKLGLMFIVKVMTVLILPNHVLAKDLGNYGQVFRIKENSILSMIHHKIQKLDMEKINKDMQDLAKKKVMNPKAVFGVVPALKTKIFYYDPSFILDEDVVLPCGTNVYNAGTVVNPLDHMDLEREIIFVDAREKKQIAWLKGKLQNNDVSGGRANSNQDQDKEVKNNEIRIILVGGSVFDMEEELQEFPDEIKEQVYFDQDGALVNQFGITHSPAVAIQEGLLLKIIEINIKTRASG